MTIKQLSIFVENKPGRLAEITGILADEHIDIRAVCVADTREFGILRLIVDDPESAAKRVKAHDCTCTLSEVLVLRNDDQPGGLAGPMKITQSALTPVRKNNANKSFACAVSQFALSSNT